MDVNELRAEVRDFLTTRRGRITPGEAGLPVYGGLRRVSGLRREELAMLTTTYQRRDDAWIALETVATTF